MYFPYINFILTTFLGIRIIIILRWQEREQNGGNVFIYIVLNDKINPSYCRNSYEIKQQREPLPVPGTVSLFPPTSAEWPLSFLAGTGDSTLTTVTCFCFFLVTGSSISSSPEASVSEDTRAFWEEMGSSLGMSRVITVGLTRMYLKGGPSW